MSFFRNIAADAVGAVVGQAFGSVEEITKAYFNKEISEMEYKAKIAAINTQFHSQAVGLMGEMVRAQDPFVRLAIPAVFWFTLFSQVWYSFIQPFGHAMWPGSFPILQPGGTVEWNFIILLGLVGLHPSSIVGQIGKLLSKDK